MDALDQFLYKVKILAIILLIASIIIGIIVVLIIWAIYINREKRSLEESGFALCRKSQATGIILGSLGHWIVCAPENSEYHTAVWGGSGTGKTTSVAIPTINHWGGGNTVFALDISGDITANLKRRDAVIYHPGDISIPYNPFYEIDYAKGREEKLKAINRLVDALRPDVNLDAGRSEFFIKCGRAILKAAFYTFYPRGLDFCEICTLICKLSPEEFLRKIYFYANNDAITEIASLKDIRLDTFASCKNQADMAVKLFATDESIKKNVRRPSPGECYIVPHILEYQSLIVRVNDSDNSLYKDLMHLITGQCFQYVFSRGLYPKNKILFCLDEFSSLGFLEIERPLDKFRKYGALIMIMSQSPLHVDIAYSTLRRKAMSENLRIQLILGSTVKDVQEEFSDMIGYKTNLQGEMLDEKKILPSRLGSLKRNLYMVYPGGSVKLRKLNWKRKRNLF